MAIENQRKVGQEWPAFTPYQLKSQYVLQLYDVYLDLKKMIWNGGAPSPVGKTIQLVNHFL